MLKTSLLLLLSLVIVLNPTFGQANPMSLLKVQSAPGKADEPEVAKAEGNFKELIWEIEKDILGAFMWYEGVILTADTEELGTIKHGTTYRVWTREKHGKMKEYSGKLEKSLRAAADKTLKLKRQVMSAFDEAEMYTGELFKAYGSLVRFISILTTFEHWASCRRIHFDNGGILAWKDSEPSFYLIGEYGLPGTRSFPKLTLSRQIPLDEKAKRLVENPMAVAGPRAFSTMQRTYEHRDSFVCHTNTFGSRYGYLDMSKLPDTMNFGNCSDEIYEQLARPAYYKFLYLFVLSTAHLSECTALMSIGQTLQPTESMSTFATVTKSFNDVKSYWQKLCDWANDRSYKRGWSRKFTVLPASFGTKDMAFPYGEITYNNLKIADLSQTSTD